MFEIVMVFVGAYLPFVIGVVAQLAFLWLPLDLRNWEDDSLNAATYVGIQSFTAAMIFVGFPILGDFVTLTLGQSFVTLGVVFVLAWFRVLRMIPLEFTFPVVATIVAVTKVSFTEFHNPLRLRALADIGTHELRSEQRFQRIRERLLKK